MFLVSYFHNFFNLVSGIQMLPSGPQALSPQGKTSAFTSTETFFRNAYWRLYAAFIHAQGHFAVKCKIISWGFFFFLFSCFLLIHSIFAQSHTFFSLTDSTLSIMSHYYTITVPGIFTQHRFISIHLSTAPSLCSHP